MDDDYLNEVINYFIYRRGGTFLVSSRDWAVVERWAKAGIPIHLVKKGIDRTLNRTRRFPHRQEVDILSLAACQNDVWEIWNEYKRAQAGAGAKAYTKEETEKETREMILRNLEAFSQGIINDLEKSKIPLSDEVKAQIKDLIINRSKEIRKQVIDKELFDYETANSAFERVDKEIFEILLKQINEDEIKKIEQEISANLAQYKNQWRDETYQKSFQLAKEKSIRERFNYYGFTLSRLILRG